MKWKPPLKPADSVQPVAQPVVFLNSNYLNEYFSRDSGQVFQRTDPFYHGQKHIFKKSGSQGRVLYKEIYCGTGPNPYAPKPCIGCYEVDHGAKGSEAKDFCAMNIAHLMPYHMVPLRDKQTQAVIFKKDEKGNPTQEPFLIEEQCTIQGCVYCQQNQQYQQQLYPVKFGAQRIYELGTGHLEAILALDTKVGMFCANCGTNIKLVSFRCQGCKNAILDIATCGWTNEQIDYFARSAYGCSCGTNDTPEEVVECGYDPQGFYKLQGKGCTDKEPKRLTLFDCVFYLQREGKDAQTKIVEVQWLPKSSFQTPDGRSLDEHLSIIAPNPFNFADLYKPDPPERQAEILGVPNYYASTAAPQSNFPAPPANPNRPNWG